MCVWHRWCHKKWLPNNSSSGVNGKACNTFILRWSTLIPQLNCKMLGKCPPPPPFKIHLYIIPLKPFLFYCNVSKMPKYIITLKKYRNSNFYLGNCDCVFCPNHAALMLKHYEWLLYCCASVQSFKHVSMPLLGYSEWLVGVAWWMKVKRAQPFCLYEFLVFRYE